MGLTVTRKCVYGLWLTTGIFVIVASLLRCILSIKDASEVDVSTIWAIRETVRSSSQRNRYILYNFTDIFWMQFVGIISVNAPVLGPWIIKKFTFIAQSVSSKDRSRSDGQNRGISIVTIGRQSYRLDRLKRDGMKHNPPGWTTINDSEEYIMEDQLHDGSNNTTASNQAASSKV